MSHAPVEAISTALSDTLGGVASARPMSTFASVLDGLEATNRQVLNAQSLATSFATDDAIPVHQVTYALEQARMSVEMMLQVRSHLVAGYQELLRMQL